MSLIKPCIISTRCKDKDGYPQVTIDGRTIAESRYVLAQKLGRPIKPDYQACHTCDNPGCIEPEHLWEGTHLQNQKDSWRKGRRTGWSGNSKKTHCPQGHLYDYRAPYGRSRQCKQCNKEAQRRHRAKVNVIS